MLLKQQQQYAEFVCGTCEHQFSDQIPPLEEKLPRCPICGHLVRILVLLVPLYQALDMFT